MNITREHIIAAVDAINNTVPSRWWVHLESELVEFCVVREPARLIEEMTEEKGESICNAFITFEVAYYSLEGGTEHELCLDEFNFDVDTPNYKHFRDVVKHLKLRDPDEALRRICEKLRQVNEAVRQVGVLAMTDESTAN